jgi:hypothetical protein
VAEPVAICGHTHIPWQQQAGPQLALNPGAVCGPLDGEPAAQYALLHWTGDGWHVEHRALPYDLAAARDAWRESGLLEAGGGFARAILAALQTGRNVPILFFQHVTNAAAAAGYAGLDVPDAVWEQAEHSFDWDAYERPRTEST